jgi:hypothetical protein
MRKPSCKVPLTMATLSLAFPLLGCNTDIPESTFNKFCLDATLVNEAEPQIWEKLKEKVRTGQHIDADETPVIGSYNYKKFHSSIYLQSAYIYQRSKKVGVLKNLVERSNGEIIFNGRNCFLETKSIYRSIILGY